MAANQRKSKAEILRQVLKATLEDTKPLGMSHPTWIASLTFDIIQDEFYSSGVFPDRQDYDPRPGSLHG